MTIVTDTLYFVLYLGFNLLALKKLSFNLESLGRTAVVSMSLFQVLMLARMVESYLSTDS